MRGRDEPISLYTAKHYMGCGVKTLRRAAEQGYVVGLIRNERGNYYATMDAWREGYEAYMRAQRERKSAAKSRPAAKMRKVTPQQSKATPPRGWVTAAEAARQLGVSHKTMCAIARARLVPLHVHRTRWSVRYYAHPQAWERALRLWRERSCVQQRHKRIATPPQARAEKARRRLESLTPYQRIALRAYIRAVMLGLPLGQYWGKRLRDEYENVVAMYGGPETAA